MSARLGVFLGLLAVLAALLAPLSLLAEEVRTGKLGGLCSASATLAGHGHGHGDDGTGQPPSGSHCNWCSSVALALPPLPVSSIPCFAGFQVGDLALPAEPAAAITGLPFSRGPPRL